MSWTPARGGGVEVGGAVVGFEADVVQALAAAFEEAGHAGVVARWLKQLDLGVAGRGGGRRGRPGPR